MSVQTIDKSKRIFTIPNLLSCLRLLMIPLFMWLYLEKQEYRQTAAVLLLSGLTDVIDGYIARRFDMVSDLGKALDPAADKLTEFSMLLCLLSRFPVLRPLAVLMVVKELVCGTTSFAAIKKTGKVLSAEWHGKVCTGLLYFTMVLHVLWVDIPAELSCALAGVNFALLVLSMGLYLRRNIRQLVTFQAAGKRDSFTGETY